MNRQTTESSHKQRTGIRLVIMNISFALFVCLVFFSSLELASFLALSTFMEIEDENLTKKFPAQFRMTRQEILKEFPKNSPLQRAGQFMRFDFDPAMGFRDLDLLRWFGGTVNDVQSKFLIVTFGGSTTQLDNWPKYLIPTALEEGVQEDLLVLNAGLAGNMTFNEKLYFTSWILPMLEGVNKKPDLVLTLDGVNDVWYRIYSYLEADREESSVWYNQYHGYHQNLDTDMKTIRTTSGAAKQLLSNLLHDLFYAAKRTLPYTLKIMIASIQNYQANMEPASVQDPQGADKLMLPRYAEEKIISGYKSSLLDFYGMAEIRGVPFVAYLQPVVLEKYYPFKIPETYPFNGINEMGMQAYRKNRLQTRMVINKEVETAPIYSMAERMYQELNSKLPGHFRSLIYLFQENPLVEELYTHDAIHYNRLGKELIAQAVIKDLVQKNLLTTTDPRQ